MRKIVGSAVVLCVTSALYGLNPETIGIIRQHYGSGIIKFGVDRVSVDELVGLMGNEDIPSANREGLSYILNMLAPLCGSPANGERRGIEERVGYQVRRCRRQEASAALRQAALRQAAAAQAAAQAALRQAAARQEEQRHQQWVVRQALLPAVDPVQEQSSGSGFVNFWRGIGTGISNFFGRLVDLFRRV
jgi:hypothetical protein